MAAQKEMSADMLTMLPGALKMKREHEVKGTEMSNLYSRLQILDLWLALTLVMPIYFMCHSFNAYYLNAITKNKTGLEAWKRSNVIKLDVANWLEGV